MHINMTQSKAMKNTHSLRLFTLSHQLVAVGLLGPASAALTPALATTEFNLDNGVQAKLNATVTFGSAYRLEDADARQLGALAASKVPGAPAGMLVGNVGGSDLNFQKGTPVSTVLKATADLELRKNGYGVFLRAKTWHDYALIDGTARGWGNYVNQYTPFVPLRDDGMHPEARFSGTEIVDAYAFGSVDVGAANPVNLKIGRQFLNWGEARMIGGGINIINPVNAPGATRPGATPEESRLAVGMVSASFAQGKDWGLDGFLQYESRTTVLPGCGTFYAVANFAPTGCNYVGVLAALTDAQALATQRYVHRSPDVNAADGGQGGLAWRLSSEALATDMRLYAMNYHSRNPSIRVTNPNVAGGYGALTGTVSRLTDPNGLKYGMVYPENIQLFGVGVQSRPLPGLQLSGELAYRPNQPLNLNASDLIAAFVARTPTSALNLAKGVNNLAPGAIFDGYDRYAVTTLNLGATQVVPKWAGAERVVFSAELGYSAVAGLPDAGRLRYGRSDDYGVAALTGLPCTDNTLSKVSCPQDGFVTSSAWGYRVRVAATYAAPFMGATLTPSLYYAQDVTGYSYDGTFMEGRRVVRPTLRADWGKKYFAEVQYNFISGGTYNTQSDRDTFGVVVGMQF